MTDALACIACGVQLSNVVPYSSENQPSDGTAFTTMGHYGSTFFDPMDGQQLEINVCDACLEGNRDRIAWRRAYRIISCEGIDVGLEYLDTPLIPYTHVDEWQDPRQVTVEELGTALSRRVMWNASACDEARHITRDHAGRRQP